MRRRTALTLTTSAANEQLTLERSLASAVEQLNGIAAGPARRSFSSTHSGVLNFLLCDGAVRQISESIEHPVDRQWSSAVRSTPWSLFERLIGRNDGQEPPAVF